MTKPEDIIESMRRNPGDVRFADLAKVCDMAFGEARTRGSHRIYRTPWKGDPRVNIQEGRNGRAKAYQVRQVLDALDKLEGGSK